MSQTLNIPTILLDTFRDVGELIFVREGPFRERVFFTLREVQVEDSGRPEEDIRHLPSEQDLLEQHLGGQYSKYPVVYMCRNSDPDSIREHVGRIVDQVEKSSSIDSTTVIHSSDAVWKLLGVDVDLLGYSPTEDGFSLNEKYKAWTWVGIGGRDIDPNHCGWSSILDEYEEDLFRLVCQQDHKGTGLIGDLGLVRVLYETGTLFAGFRRWVGFICPRPLGGGVTIFYV